LTTKIRYPFSHTGNENYKTSDKMNEDKNIM